MHDFNNLNEKLIKKQNAGWSIIELTCILLFLNFAFDGHIERSLIDLTY